MKVSSILVRGTIAGWKKTDTQQQQYKRKQLFYFSIDIFSEV